MIMSNQVHQNLVVQHFKRIQYKIINTVLLLKKKKNVLSKNNETYPENAVFHSQDKAIPKQSKHTIHCCTSYNESV